MDRYRWHSLITIWQDIAETQREIEQLELKSKINPRLESWYKKQIEERKLFIKKLEKFWEDLSKKRYS